MKLVTLRLTEYMVTLNEEEWPIAYSHHVASLGFTVEVRINDTLTAYVTATTVALDGEIQYAGKGYLSSYSDVELYRCISMEAFNVAASLGVPAHHIWPLLEQFPQFSETGIKVGDAETYEGPIRDLLARGATPSEVVRSLDISRDLYEFVLGAKLPREPPQDMTSDQDMTADDNAGW